jgi:large exoprotein involved in heme utilization and adhesion
VSYVGYEALGKGGKITIDVPSIVFGPYSKLWSVTNGVGHGGDVLIRTHNIEAKAGSVLFTDTAPWANGGNGGNFTLVGTGRLIMGTDPVPPFDHWILAGDVTSIGAFSAGPGRSGDVTINIPEIRGYNGSNFVAFGKNTGDAGNVTINTERMSLSGKSSVYVWAVNDFGGRHLNNAGNISINASESFEMSSDREAYRESRFDQTLFYRGGIRLQAMTDGNAGTMAITSPRIVLDDVTVEASNWFAGGGGRIEINTNDLTLRNGARIDTKAMPESSGNAGSIVVNARDRVDLSGMSLFDGSFSGISAQTWGGGAGGDVRIRTDELSIDRGYVKSSTGGAGRAGSVDIEARRVMLTSGATIDAGTTDISTGAGGSVRVSASEAITLSGIDRNAIVAIPEQPERTPIWADALGPGRAQGPSPSQISSNTAGAGAGGNVVVSAPQILIEDGARITANSTGTGTAGSIFLTATDWLKLNNGAITTQALASDGGNIDIRVNNMLRLNNSEISTSVGSGSGSGGNIFIDPTFVILESSRIAANAFGGAGGNINVIANVFLASPDSVIDASSQLGVPGSVQVSAPRTDAVSGLPALPVQFFDATGLLREACAGPAGATRSRLIGLGRGGVAETPFSYAASRYFEDTPMSAAEIVRPPALTSAALGESALLGQMCQL